MQFSSLFLRNGHTLLAVEWKATGCQQKARRELKNKSQNSAQSQSASSPHDKGCALSLRIDAGGNGEVWKEGYWVILATNEKR